MVKIQDGIKADSDDLRDLSFYDYLVKLFRFMEEKLEFEEKVTLEDIFNPPAIAKKKSDKSLILQDTFGKSFRKDKTPSQMGM